MAGRSYNLVGEVFSELTVISYHSLKVTGKRSEKLWLCNCSCGIKGVLVSTRALRKGRKKSCGHLQNGNKKSNNKYIIKDNYTIVYTTKNEPFYIDTEDLEKVLYRTWYKHHTGYINCKMNNKQIRLHRYLMDAPNDKEVDHINHIPHDNRKRNLRICDRVENSWNSPIRKNNTSGVTGVWFDKACGKWIAHIRCNGENMYLGLYANKEDAIKTRINAEIKYFGEYQSKKEEDLPLPILSEDYFDLNLHNDDLLY
jgi:hypothetical protein